MTVNLTQLVTEMVNFPGLRLTRMTLCDKNDGGHILIDKHCFRVQAGNVIERNNWLLLRKEWLASFFGTNTP